MRTALLVTAAFLALMLAGPSRADSTAPVSNVDPIIEQLLTPENILRGQFTEQDVSEIFAVIRANMAGKQVEPSERLKKKLETFGQSLQARGALIGMLLLNEMEQNIKQMVRELNRQPGAI